MAQTLKAFHATRERRCQVGGVGFIEFQIAFNEAIQCSFFHGVSGCRKSALNDFWDTVANHADGLFKGDGVTIFLVEEIIGGDVKVWGTVNQGAVKVE
jgi:hypothetical protein